MPNWLYIIPEFIRIALEGRYTGDLAILKTALGRFRPSPIMAAYLKTLEKRTPDFSGVEFIKMPKGSLGREYLRFFGREQPETIPVFRKLSRSDAGKLSRCSLYKRA